MFSTTLEQITSGIQRDYSSASPKQAQPRRETPEEFLARGGKIQEIPIGASSCKDMNIIPRTQPNGEVFNAANQIREKQAKAVDSQRNRIKTNKGSAPLAMKSQNISTTKRRYLHLRDGTNKFIFKGKLIAKHDDLAELVKIRDAWLTENGFCLPD